MSFMRAGTGPATAAGVTGGRRAALAAPGLTDHELQTAITPGFRGSGARAAYHWPAHPSLSLARARVKLLESRVTVNLGAA